MWSGFVLGFGCDCWLGVCDDGFFDGCALFLTAVVVLGVVAFVAADDELLVLLVVPVLLPGVVGFLT